MLVFALTGCVDKGSKGEQGETGAGVASKSLATELTITITSASINDDGMLVVQFSAVNEDDIPVAGLNEDNLRFNSAKLIPGSPAKWQNYINRSNDGAVQGSQERSRSGYSWGTLVDNLNGTYSYMFATNIKTVECPEPCTDADGNSLDLSYQAGLTHRVTIQLSGLTPLYNAVYDFVPSGGVVATTRDIVNTAKCNECHNTLKAHGSRVETKFCVTCHNPGSWINDGGNVQTVDFPVLIHKIHHGDELPSVLDPDGDPATTDKGTYAIGTHDFSEVAFPQDIRNCTKCHDGTEGASNVTTNGDNWKNQPTKAACSACHDDLYFGLVAEKSYQTVSHMALIESAGGVAVADPADSLCVSCHVSGELAGSVESSHEYPALVEAQGAKYQFNILSVTNSAPNQSPVVTFSVTDPTNGDAKYDLKNDTSLSAGSLSLMVGWSNTDENNNGSTSNPGQPLTISLVGSGASNAVDNGDMTYTVDLATASLGSGASNRVIPASVTGSGRAAIYGRAVMDVNGDGATDRIPVKAAYKDFAITDAAPVARRQVVDIEKCDKCHRHVSLHGESRTDEPGLCVMCHNPSATDVTKRPKDGSGFPDASAATDGKTEESIDFKRMIHGIHSAGFREKGLVVYGYHNSVNDFSTVGFPGIINDCLTCHVTPTGSNAGSYELSGNWEVPTASGVLGSTVSTVPDTSGSYTSELADQADDLNITPTAAVCSSCHDGVVAKSHMILNGAIFDATQAAIDASGTLEACAICHGPGRIADVKSVHDVE